MADKKISQLTASTTPLVGTEILPIVQSGVTKQVSVTNLTSGKVVQVNGIQFPNTEVASADANTLDDYEEGSWIPTLIGADGTSGQTYTRVNGAYTKVGRQVTCSCEIQLAALGTVSGRAAIGGLPFAVGNSRRFRGGISIGFLINLTTSYVYVTANFSENATRAEFMGMTAAATSLTFLNATDMLSNTTTVWATFTYFTD